MSTTLIYNDVVMRDCETLSFDQQVIYDESGTDVLYSRFVIRVASTLVAIRNDTNTRQFGVAPPQGSTIVQRMQDVQTRLSQARKDFWFLVDHNVQDERQGTGVFNAPALDQPLLVACGEAFTETMEDILDEEDQVIGQRIVKTPLTMLPHPFSNNCPTARYGPGTPIPKSDVLDCNNGPSPKDLKISKIIGGRSFRVEFEIEVCQVLCLDDFPDPKPAVFGDITGDNRVISNRWSISEEVNEHWVTTKTLQGTLRVANKCFWPQAMRYLCVPPLLNGYRRKSQSFVSDPTDLILKYKIVDEQKHSAPPPPAIDMRGHHNESASGAYGGVKHGEFRIRLIGPIGVNKLDMAAAGVKVAFNRIKGLSPQDPDPNAIQYDTVLRNASITDVLGRPEIEVFIRVEYNSNEYEVLALGLKEIGKPLDMGDLPAGHDPATDPDPPDYIDGYAPQAHPVPLFYDSARPAGIFACYLQDPCSQWHDVPGGYTPDSEGIDSPTKPDRQESGDPDSNVYPEEDDIPADDPPIRDDTASGYVAYPMTYLEVTQTYQFDNGYSALPLATTAPGGRSAAVIQIHKPTAVRILTLTATRNGKPPLIPDLTKELIDPNGHKEFLDEFKLTMSAPKTGPSGYSREYSVRVDYFYKLETAPAENETLRGVSSPLDKFTPDSNSIDLSEIQDTGGIIVWKQGVTQTYPPPSP